MVKICKNPFYIILFFTLPLLPVEYLLEFFPDTEIQDWHLFSKPASSPHDDEEAELFFVYAMEDEEEEEKPSKKRKKQKKT